MLSINTNTKSSRFSKRLDSLFWWLLKLLPLVMFVCYIYGYYRSGNTDVATNEFFSIIQNYCMMSFDNVVFQTLFSVFGPEGALPLFNSVRNPIAIYLSYIVIIDILHIMVDVLVFIPRLAHKWIGKAVQDD